jgi:hypothetical protein
MSDGSGGITGRFERDGRYGSVESRTLSAGDEFLFRVPFRSGKT